MLVLPIEEVPAAVGGINNLVTRLVLRVLGDLPSTQSYLSFPRKTPFPLLADDRETGPESNIIGDLERSALKEVRPNSYQRLLRRFKQFCRFRLCPHRSRS